MPLIDGQFTEYKLPPKHARVLTDSSKAWRYRALEGGRNGAKDWSVIALLAEIGIRKPLRVLFTREVQASIEESIYELLCNTIDRLGYSDYYTIYKNSIVGVQHKTKFIFKGIRDMNKNDVKSYEDIDIAVVCEAEDFSEDSFDALDPTIRKPNSEVWFIFNPSQEDDFVYKFCVTNPPDNMISGHVTYLDHNYTSDVIIAQAEYDRINHPDKYDWKWMGQPKNTGGLIYPMFDPDVHVRDVDLARIEPVANFFMGQDPHTVYYPFCLWLGREPRGDGSYTYYVYNEYPMTTTGGFNGKLYHELRKEKKCTLTLNQRATLYKILDNTTDVSIPAINKIIRGIDTRFAKGAGTGSTTNNTRGVIAEMADPDNGGLVFETPPEYMIDAQRERLRQLMWYDTTQPLTAFNEPKIYFSSHCYNIIDSLKFHRFDRSGKEKEDEKRKDAVDALRIALATEQQHAHKLKPVKSEFKPIVRDAVRDLRGAYSGKKAMGVA